MTFDEFDLDPRCLRVLEGQGINEPTPIQELAIPPVLAGRDLIATAQTGTGKTLAFSLPTHVARRNDVALGASVRVKLAPESIHLMPWSALRA